MIFEITIINGAEDTTRTIVFSTLLAGQVSDEEAYIEAVKFAHNNLNQYEFVATIDYVAG